MAITYDRITSSLARHLTLLRLALMALMLASFAKALVDFSHIIQAVSVQPVHPPVSGVPPVGALPDIQAIAQSGWFGLTPQQAAPGAGNTGAALAQFDLKGVSKSEHAQLVGAFIAEKGKPENYYHVGDALPGGAGTLEAVFADHVTVRSGQGVNALNFTAADMASPATPPTMAPPMAGYPMPPNR